MKVVFYKRDAEHVRFEEKKDMWRSAYIWVEPTVSTPSNLCMGTCELDPLNRIPAHAHKNEEEIMFVYKGKGKAVIDGKSYQLTEETVMLILKGMQHEIQNLSATSKLYFTWVFYPTGIERLIRRKHK